MYRKKYHIHFVGIGGIGMSGIAELLLNLGYRVSGSDLRLSDLTARLAHLGARVHSGHAPEHVQGADVVVCSSAVHPDNPEVVVARESGIPVIPRAEMLAELMRLKYSVAVAGAHGKTTTTSIVASIMAQGGLDPTVVIGGKLKGIGANARLGKGDFIVAEADESDGSFLKMSPTIAVVTNIDREHLDHYKDLPEIVQAFAGFVDRVPFYGLSALCLDSEPIQDLIPRLNKRYTTYGLTPQADLQAVHLRQEGLGTHFTVVHLGKPVGQVYLNLPGTHNVYNSLAGIAVAMELDIAFEDIRAALGKLEGVQRRMETKGRRGEVTVIDDYGHHPTEIRTTLQTIRDLWPLRRIVVAFQPHRYSRTAALFQDFVRSFYQADLLVVLPIYPAGEQPVAGVDHAVLCTELKAHGHKGAQPASDFDEAAAVLHEILKPGDILLTLGAGDIWKLGQMYLGETESNE